MHKELPNTRASPLKRATFGGFIFLFAGLIYFIFAKAGPGSLNLQVLGFGSNEIRAFVIVRLTNSGSSTITYDGLGRNDPYFLFQVRTAHGLFEDGGCSSDSRYDTRHIFELKPHESVDFQVFIDNLRMNYRVELRPNIKANPGLLDWLRIHAPNQLSRWFPRPHQPVVLSPLIKTNSLFFR